MGTQNSRRYPRAALQSVITIDSPEPDGGRLLLASEDICVGGCRVQAKRRIGIGRILMANIILNTRVIRTIVKVVHGAKSLTGFTYGVEFLFLAPEDYDSVELYVLSNLSSQGGNTIPNAAH